MPAFNVWMSSQHADRPFERYGGGCGMAGHMVLKALVQISLRTHVEMCSMRIIGDGWIRGHLSLKAEKQ